MNQTEKTTKARVVLLGLALLAMSYSFLVFATPSVAADATTDAVNSTVTLVTSLLFALIPLIVIMSIFSLIMGLLVGRSGIFASFEHKQ